VAFFLGEAIPELSEALLALTPYEARTTAAIFERYIDAQAVEVLQIDPVTNGGTTADRGWPCAPD
jgi:L-alanine-DL-glutamate epimerase-like enolase superfamily enzyme